MTVARPLAVLVPVRGLGQQQGGLEEEGEKGEAAVLEDLELEPQALQAELRLTAAARRKRKDGNSRQNSVRHSVVATERSEVPWRPRLASREVQEELLIPPLLLRRRRRRLRPPPPPPP